MAPNLTAKQLADAKARGFNLLQGMASQQDYEYAMVHWADPTKSAKSQNWGADTKGMTSNPYAPSLSVTVPTITGPGVAQAKPPAELAAEKAAQERARLAFQRGSTLHQSRDTENVDTYGTWDATSSMNITSLINDRYKVPLTTQIASAPVGAGVGLENYRWTGRSVPEDDYGASREQAKAQQYGNQGYASFGLGAPIPSGMPPGMQRALDLRKQNEGRIQATQELNQFLAQGLAGGTTVTRAQFGPGPGGQAAYEKALSEAKSRVGSVDPQRLRELERAAGIQPGPANTGVYNRMGDLRRMESYATPDNPYMSADFRRESMLSMRYSPSASSIFSIGSAWNPSRNRPMGVAGYGAGNVGLVPPTRYTLPPPLAGGGRGTMLPDEQKKAEYFGELFSSLPTYSGGGPVKVRSGGGWGYSGGGGAKAPWSYGAVLWRI